MLLSALLLSERYKDFEGLLMHTCQAFRTITVFCIITIFSSLGCQEKSFDPESPSDVFAQASEPYEDGMYDIAIQKLGAFKSRFPYSRHTIQAELMIADSHFQLGNYEESAFSYDEFIKLHPNHQKVPFARYRIGESYWIEAPDDIDREQDYTQKALKEWKVLTAQFPNHEYAIKVAKKIKEGEVRIAKSEAFVMNFYCRQEIYHSCAYKALIILDLYRHFPEIKSQALKQASISFEKLAQQKQESPDSDKNLYVASMSTAQLLEKAKTFKKLIKHSAK